MILTLTIKEITAPQALRKEQAYNDDQFGFMDEAYINFKKDNADATPQGFASLIGHLEAKGVFDDKEEEFVFNGVKEVITVRYELTEEAMVAVLVPSLEA